MLLIVVLTLRFLSFDALMLEFLTIPTVFWDRLISCHWFGLGTQISFFICYDPLMGDRGRMDIF